MKRIILFTVFIFFTAFFVFGDSWYVQASGNDYNSGLSQTTPFRTLEKAIQAASGSTTKTITVIGTLDRISENSEWDNTVFYINVNNNELITIRGKPDAAENERAILSAKDSGCRVIYIANSNIHFEYIDITGGERSNNHGGGIYVDLATVSIGPKTRIYSNSASAGGGVYIHDNGRVTIQDTEIFENTAQWGGGIYSHGEINIEESNIHNNTSIFGGGIQIDNSKVLIKNSNIINNTADRIGGGIMITENSTAEIIASEINENRCNRGGGIMLENSKAIIKESILSENYALSDGGGIYVGKNGILDIIECITRENISWRGAGIAIASEGIVAMTGGTIIKNHSNYDTGGGVNIEENGSFTMNGGIITENISHDTGGGINVKNGGKLIIENGIISKNRAGSDDKQTAGGGIFINLDAEFSMKGGAISENYADYGGGININSDSKLYGVHITDNKAGVGGGIALGSKLELIDCIIAGNYAKEVGGGVITFIQGGHLIMHGGEAVNNHANDSGGAFNLQSPSEFYSVLINNNQSLYGGGIYTSSSLLLQDCVISSNKAFHGGGIYTRGQSSKIDNCKFYNNFTFFTGAALRIQESNIVTNSIEIIKNKTSYGGAVFISGGGSFIVNSGTITQNSANLGNSIYMEKETHLQQKDIVDDQDIYKEE